MRHLDGAKLFKGLPVPFIFSSLFCSVICYSEVLGVSGHVSKVLIFSDIFHVC